MQLSLAFTILASVIIPAIAIPNALPETPLEKRIDHTGIGTIFLQQGGTGSCGAKNPDSAKIAALSNYWQKNQSPGPYCGRKVSVANIGSNDGVGGKGNTIVATVADTCPSCTMDHIDFSKGAWDKLTNGAAFGTVNIVWHFLAV